MDSVPTEDSKGGKDAFNEKEENTFPTNLDNLTEKDIQRWFNVAKVAGGEILKVKPEMFEKPRIKGEPEFFCKASVHLKPKKESLVFEEDF